MKLDLGTEVGASTGISPVMEINAIDVAPPNISHPTERERTIVKEIYFGSWNLIIFFGEFARWAQHHSAKELPGLGQGTPVMTEGIQGFFDQHMGNVWEAIACFYLARIPIEIGAKLLEAHTDKKVSPRVRVGLALLVGMTIPALAELKVIGWGNSTPDVLDLFGSLLAGIWAGAGWEIINFLSKPRETSLFTQCSNALKAFKEKIERTNMKLQNVLHQIKEKMELASDKASDKLKQFSDALDKNK